MKLLPFKKRIFNIIRQLTIFKDQQRNSSDFLYHRGELPKVIVSVFWLDIKQLTLSNQFQKNQVYYTCKSTKLLLFKSQQSFINLKQYLQLIPYSKQIISLFGIYDTPLRYLESCLVLCQARRIKYLTDSLLSFAFAEIETSSTGMGKNMSSYGFLGVYMSHSVAWISHNLIGHVNCNVELFGEFHKSAQNFSQHLLSLGQLASPSKIISKDCHDRINYQQRVWTFHHHYCRRVEKCNQMFNCIATSVFYIFKSLLRVKLIPLSYLDDSLWSKCPLSIYVNDFTISSSFLARQLSGNTKSMGQLCFSSSELPKSLGDSHGLYTSSEQFIQYRRASGNSNNIFSFQSDLVPTHEPMILYLFGGLQNLVNFGLVYTFDVREFFFGSHDYT